MSDAKERILQAAIKIFAEKGYAPATTRTIAREAGVHQPAISYHFSNKEKLWKCAVAKVWNDLMDALDRKMATVGVNDDRVREFVDFYLRYIAEVPQSIIFIIKEGSENEDRTLWFIKTQLTPQADKIYHAMTGCRWPSGKQQDTLHALSLLSILTGSTRIFSQRFQTIKLFGIDPISPEFISEHVDAVTTAVKALLPVKSGNQ